MGQVTLCLGRYAKNPYYIDKMCAKVYCVEELCYLLRENAFLLDRQIVDKRLAEWLDKECGLTELAKSLNGFIHAGCSAGAFVTTILEYTGYYTKEEISGVEQLLKNNGDLSGEERLKIHADYLVQKGRYMAAVREYGELLQREGTQDEFAAKLHHNRGSAYSGMFLFAQAAEEFKAAYELTKNSSELEYYLTAKRLLMTETEYVDWISGQLAGKIALQNAPVTEASLVLEGRIRQVLSQWEASVTGEEYNGLMAMKAEGRMTEYYEAVSRIAAGLKNSYRKRL